MQANGNAKPPVQRSQQASVQEAKQVQPASTASAAAPAAAAAAAVSSPGQQSPGRSSWEARSAVRAAMHALADSDEFISLVVAQLGPALKL